MYEDSFMDVRSSSLRSIAGPTKAPTSWQGLRAREEVRMGCFRIHPGNIFAYTLGPLREEGVFWFLLVGVNKVHPKRAHGVTGQPP